MTPRVRAVGGAKRVSVAFFTGERKIAFPEVTRAEGNPVLLCFLERDIREMECVTGGKSGYFRPAWRWRGRQTSRGPGFHSPAGNWPRGITITPYADDALKDRIGKYASKTYVFTLSVDVPGGVYSVRTFVPSPDGTPNDAPLLEERLSLVRIAKGT